ncbi:MAG: hypothetical protein DRI54_06575 [Bacteroidetes bacterium]|nr:MAG: hypothetical protein DRI54_06575 [Bacteroidota bacterium]
MKKIYSLLTSLIFVILVSCTNNMDHQDDLINDSILKSRAEIREVIKSIVKDAETANIEGLENAHLMSEKFSKFGPRSFDRQNVKNTNESEAAFFGSVSNFKQEARDLKIDVFDDIAIATYYPHISFVQDGVEKKGSGRQTLVFLKTKNGWKIIHEHGTQRPS